MGTTQPRVEVVVSLDGGSLRFSAAQEGLTDLTAFDACISILRPYLVERETDDFEIVTPGSQSSISGAYPETSSLRSARVPSEGPGAQRSQVVPSWEERKTFAEAHGASAARVLRGEAYAPPSCIGLQLSNCVWVLLRDSEGRRPAGGYKLFTRWHDIAPAVQVTVSEAGKTRKVLGDRAVFKAWPSRREAHSYLRGAGIAVEISC